MTDKDRQHKDCSTEGKTFKKHSQLRASFHRDLIKPGRIDASWGVGFYEWIFDHHQQADYQPIVHLEADEVGTILDQANAFVSEKAKDGEAVRCI